MLLSVFSKGFLLFNMKDKLQDILISGIRPDIGNGQMILVDICTKQMSHQCKFLLRSCKECFVLKNNFSEAQTLGVRLFH